jgi:trypsin
MFGRRCHVSRLREATLRRCRSRHPGALLTVSVFALALLCLPANSAAAAEPQAKPSIAGGYYPDPSAWPWVTALVDPTRTATNGDLGQGFCTAVLIAPQRVLTAAHCVVGDDQVTPRPAYRFQALVGRRDLTITSQGERRNVTGVAVHPKVYLPQTGVHTYHAFYDIAVLFLDRPVTNIPPAVIGAPTDWNTWATAMGFGHWNYDHNNPQYDQYLRAADYDLLSDAQCGSWFDDATTQHFFGTIHVCANNAPGAAVDCITHGDSGGPLMVLMTTGWKLIGITSFYPHRADRCGAGGPFGFAWVAGSEMRSWPLTVPHPPVQDDGGGGGDQLDLSMARSELRGYIRSMIRGHTSGRISGLRRSCTRTSYRSFSCDSRWRVRRYRFKGTAAIWAYADDGVVYWTYAFRGTSHKSGCSQCRVKRLKW